MASFKIIIDHSKVAADLTDFPVYINLADMPYGFWSTVTSGGGDIRCYDINDNELAREVVSCDTTLKSGELHIRANVSSTVPTILKINIDGTSSDYLPTDTYGTQAVWSNGYVGVWHLDNLTDSSGCGNGLSESGASAVEIGKVGYGRHVTSGSMLPTGNDASLQISRGTLSAWVRTTEVTSQGNDRSTGVIIKESAWGIYIDQGYLGTYQWVSPQRYETSSTFVADGNWHLLTFVFDSGALGGSSFIVDGSMVSSFSYVTGIQNKAVTLGGVQTYTQQNPRDLYVDEARVCGVVHSTGWLTTEYNNQSSTTTFYTIENFVQAPIPYSDGYAYVYENVGYFAPNSGEGYGYSYENVGYNAPNSGEGYGYSYENVGYNAPNSGEGYGYSYENVTLYVISNNDMLPPIIS